MIQKSWPWDEAKCFAPGPAVESLEQLVIEQAFVLRREITRRRLLQDLGEIVRREVHRQIKRGL